MKSKFSFFNLCRLGFDVKALPHSSQANVCDRVWRAILEIGRPKTRYLSLVIAALLMRSSVALSGQPCIFGMIDKLPPSQYAALVALYNSTGGPGWIDNSGWLDPNAFDWSGVAVVDFYYNPDTCEIVQVGHVYGLGLILNNLTGSIPPELGQLSQLNYLSLLGNHLTGPIPPELGQLLQLETLEVYSNQLTGSIPPELGQLSQIQHFLLSDNHLTGSIPPELGQLSQSRYIVIYNNQLTGSLPIELAQLTQLDGFVLFNNCLSLGDPTSQSVIKTLQNAGVIVDYLPQCGLTVSLLGCNSSDAYSNVEGSVDEPLKPKPNPAILTNQPEVERGVVADGVTPLVFKIEQGEPAQATYNVTVDNPLLRGHIHALNGAVWDDPPSLRLTFDGTNTTGFVYLDAENLDTAFANGQTELSATLTLTNNQDPSDVTTKVFSVRRPPIFLVHGYRSDRGAWGEEFVDALTAATQRDFILRVNYGVTGDYNRYASFDALVPELESVLSNEANTLRNDWAFTRYDVVGHSQGGILARLLCGQYRTLFTREFKGPSNFNRGRFRRIITISSPHNGTTMAYYASKLNLLNRRVYGVVPTILRALGYFEPKFDPFGEQIPKINAASAEVHPDAHKFHLITAKINGGDVPPLPWPFIPAVYSSIGLNGLSIHNPPSSCNTPLTHGRIVLNCGSDGVNDIETQRAGKGTPFTQMPGDIAHLLPFGSRLTALAFFGTSRGDTTDVEIAAHIATLLSGSGDPFGAFQRPDYLGTTRQTEIDKEIPLPSDFDLIRRLGPFPVFGMPSITSTSYTFNFTPDPSEPLDGTANWFAEVFGPNGVTTDGITVTPDPSDSTLVTVDVDNSVVGDVALYLSHNSTTGHLIFGRPVLVVSIPPGANLTGIEVHPNQMTANVGDIIGLEIWRLYDNSSTSQLFVQPENSTFSSSNPSVASVDSGTGLLNAVEPGSATVTATYSGHTNNATIHVNPPSRSIRDPRQRPSPPQPRPTPPPHITPVPPPPSPRPTPAPRP